MLYRLISISINHEDYLLSLTTPITFNHLGGVTATICAELDLGFMWYVEYALR